MPKGKRRQLLSERFIQFVDKAFTQRLLAFDEAAAQAYGELMAHRKDIGRPMSSMDGQIAAIALSKGFSVATRNIKDFEHCDIKLINPFDWLD